MNRASSQSGPQRLAGLVELADAVYEDLQSCYGIYASLFHRWGPGLCPPSLPPAPQGCRQAGGGASRCVTFVPCSITDIDFFTLTFRQLERLVRRGCGEKPPGWEGARFPRCWWLECVLLSRWPRRPGC